MKRMQSMADYDLDRLLVQVRRIEEHRENGAEKEIRKAYQALLKNLRYYLADEYSRYAEDDKLTYEILQSRSAYARFLEEVEQKINDNSPEVKRIIRSTVEQTYEYTYNGMIDCVKRAVADPTVTAGLKACTPDILRRAVENPVSKLTLNDRLEKHRKEIVYNIKQDISVGLMNGDRYSTMANRIKKSIEGDYKKAIRIARTETHRIREAGNHDAAQSVDEVLKTGESGMRMHKTWRTMKDERVRPVKAKGKNRQYNHKKMDGVAILVDGEFTLPSGAKTMAPGQSGVAGEDINCRCYLSYGLRKMPESDKVRLETDEEWAVNSYVSFDSYPLNDALRNDIPLNTKQQKLVDNLDTALKVFPHYEGNLNRSLDFSDPGALEYFNSMPQDGKVVFKEFLSTTKEGIYNTEGNVQIFIQNSRQGRDLGRFNEAEKEVLYPRGSSFNVLDKQERDGVYYILLEEV